MIHRCKQTRRLQSRRPVRADWPRPFNTGTFRQTSSKYASHCLDACFRPRTMIDSVSSLCPIDLIPFAASNPPATPPQPTSLPNIEDYESDFFPPPPLYRLLLLTPPLTNSGGRFVFVNFCCARHKNKEALVTQRETHTGRDKAESR